MTEGCGLNEGGIKMSEVIYPNEERQRAKGKELEKDLS